MSGLELLEVYLWAMPMAIVAEALLAWIACLWVRARNRRLESERGKP